MFSFDFDGLNGDAGAAPVKEPSRPKAAAKAQVKAKARAKVRSKQNVSTAETDYLMQLQIAEKERAAAALAMMRSQMSAAAAAPPLPARPAVCPVPRTVQASLPRPLFETKASRVNGVCPSLDAEDGHSSPEVLTVEMPPKVDLQIRSPMRETSSVATESVEMREAREDDEARRAAREAAVERSIEHDRRSGWWRRLEQPSHAAPIERCGVLPLHVGTGSVSSSSSSAARRRLHNPLEIPTQEFMVECAVVTIRAEPSHVAPVCGAKRRGDRVTLVEESFNGWGKLAEEPGWIPRAPETESATSKSETPALRPLDGRAFALLASQRPSRSQGRQMFEVLCEAGGEVFREPARGALRLGTRCCGEFLLADTQTYHGWVRLSDDEGWARACTEAGGRLLQAIRPDELQLAATEEGTDANSRNPSSMRREVAEECDRSAVKRAEAEADAREQEQAARQEALRALEHAARSGVNSAMFCAAVEVARERGVAKRDIARCNALRCSR